MDNKLMAQIFSDAISSSKSPVVVNGQIYKLSRGYINLTEELLEAMLYAQKELQCKNVKFGSYDCYENTMFGFPVDGCLVGEINSLNNQGIKTIGCCCGHSRQQGYIQVAPEFCDNMKELGYEQLPTKSEMYATWCFKPKTVLPKHPESVDEFLKTHKIISPVDTGCCDSDCGYLNIDNDPFKTEGEISFCNLYNKELLGISSKTRCTDCLGDDIKT